MHRRVALSMVTEGFVPRSAIRDETQRLVLAAGRPMTAEILAGLKRRNVRTLLADEGDWRRLLHRLVDGGQQPDTPAQPVVALPQRRVAVGAHATSVDPELDAWVDALGDATVRPSPMPFASLVQRHGCETYDHDLYERAVEQHEQTLVQLRDLLQALNGDNAVELDALQSVTARSLEQAAEDLDLFVSLGINPGLNTSIFTHSRNVSVLAVAIGARLGLDIDSLRDLGTGCLVQNAGMLQIDSQIYETPKILSDEEFAPIAQHPLITTEMISRNMKEVPIGVRMVVYQIHERLNGSGYPRGITGDKIHPLAKIAAVADAYVALVSPRPHRPPMTPYRAMEQMLHDVKAGLYDSKVVRALLNTVSLFPIGSYVELNNSLVGRTIRAAGPSYDRPILETWRRTNLKAPPHLVDLTQETNLKVVRALADPY